MFFSEEKNQKTFMSCASPTMRLGRERAAGGRS
jgi:hypothetical protein